jgi:ribosomal protein L14
VCVTFALCSIAFFLGFLGLPKASSLTVFDNSGARSLKTFVCLCWFLETEVRIGLVFELLFVLIKKAVPHKKVKRGDKHKAVLYAV